MDTATILALVKLLTDLGMMIFDQYFDTDKKEIVIARELLDQLLKSAPEYVKIYEMATKGELTAAMLLQNHKSLDELKAKDGE